MIPRTVATALLLPLLAAAPGCGDGERPLSRTELEEGLRAAKAGRVHVFRHKRLRLDYVQVGVDAGLLLTRFDRVGSARHISEQAAPAYERRGLAVYRACNVLIYRLTHDPAAERHAARLAESLRQRCA